MARATPSTMGRGYDPLPSFRFVIELNDQVVGAFTECKLPNIDWKPDMIKEGGQNGFVHQLPGQRKPTKITLKRGLAVSTHLMDWYIQAMQANIYPRRVTVKLLNSLREPAIIWMIENAYPMKWTGISLKTKSKTLAIETLMLSCGYIEVTKGHGY